MVAYYRTTDGQLEITSMTIVDGEVYSPNGWPLIHTNVIEKLTGWPDKTARVYLSGTGNEYLVPEPSKS